jgi:transcriptional activator
VLLWRGDPLETLKTESARERRLSITEYEWIPVSITIAEALIELEEYGSAIARTDQLYVENSTVLDIVKLRLTALYKLGRQEEAVNLFLAARQRLRQDDNQPAADDLLRVHDGLVDPVHQSSVRPSARRAC